MHHKLESLSKGEFILTLKDANILELEDTGDVLENVNLAEEERHQNNIAGIRAAKNNLGNEDELGNKLGLLSKYDYDQEKPDSDSIVLGSRGDVDLNAALALRNSKGTVPGRIMESLELAPPKEASSYEEVKESKIFRKKSNIRKIKAKIVEPHVNSVSGASEVLNALAEDDTNSSRDHGIRNKRSTELKPDFPPQPPLNDIPSKGTPPPKVIDYSKSNSKVDISNMNFVDDDDIQRALSASRRVTVIRTKIQDPMQIADSARTSDPNIPPPSDARGLVFSATTDFAKNLRIEPRIKPKESLKPKIIPEVPSTQTEDISLVLDRLESKKQDGGPRSGWIEITEDGNYTPPKNNDSMHSDGHISEREDVSTKLAGGGALEEEPLLSAGIGSAVTLLKQKGEIKQLTADELEKEKRILNRELWLSEKKRSMRINQLEMRNERENNRNKQKKGNKGGNDNNRVREEREIRRAKRERIAFTVDLYKNYSPEINLDRFDEFGRKLNQKEAFRQLSHKFHGKASGKIKTEKRLRKIHEELSTAQKSM